MELGRDQILAADDIRRELVPTPEWGGKVWVAGLTAGARAELEKQMLSGGQKNTIGMRERVAAESMVDKDGARLFELKDIPALSKKSASAMDRVFTVAMRLSRLMPEDFAETVEDLVDGQSDDSPTD